MTISRSQNNKINYLGFWVDSKFNPDEEITCRIQQVRSAFTQISNRF